MTMTSLQPGASVGRFRVTGRLGRWPIGTAYQVSAGTESGIALTVQLKAGGASGFERWVALETGRTLGLAESHRAPIDGGLLAPQLGWLVIPPFPRCTLLQVVRKNGRLPPERAAVMGHRVAQLLAAAHASGVVVGALRPTSVLLDDVTAQDPYLFDLGLERGLDEVLLQPPPIAPAYRAPDRIAGRRPRVSDDIYALGALLYYMLTGSKPPRSPQGVVSEAPSSRSSIRDDAAFLDPIILKALATEAVARYPSMALMVDALGALTEVFALSKAARSVLEPSTRVPQTPFVQSRTHPHLLHDLLGVPHARSSSIDTLDEDPED